MSVHAENVSVVFPGIKALDNVSTSFIDGKIKVILGANGSGKSTLIKVLTGVYQPENGASFTIGEQRIDKIQDPSAATALGIRAVHQEAPLIGTMSVEESVALFRGYPLNKLGLIDWKKVTENCKKLLENLNINISPHEYVSHINAAERAMLLMSIAIGSKDDIRDTNLLILDEAESSLDEKDSERFLKAVREIADRGIPVCMITHRLNSARQICDEIMVLNNGKVVYDGPADGIDDDTVIKIMIGEEKNENIENETAVDVTKLWEVLGDDVKRVTGENALEIRELCSTNVHDLTFTVKSGEIIGIAGVADNGLKDMPLILSGDVPFTSGEFLVDGQKLRPGMKIGEAVKAGIVLVPSDRFRQGAVMRSTLKENILMPNEKKYYMRSKLADQAVAASVETLDIRPPYRDMIFAKFSGGNQQKAIISKWLLTSPKVLVLDDPTYGVDPGARMRIFSAILNSAKNGVGVIIFSTEPEQLSMLCDRVIIMRNGKNASELKKEDGSLNRETIVRWCYV